jgi:hypothetical protein
VAAVILRTWVSKNDGRSTDGMFSDNEIREALLAKL